MRKIILHSIFFCASLQLAGQQEREGVVLYSLTEKDGLTDNNITCFFQDSRGIMWMGTPYGLNSFDGSVILNYHAGAGKNGLASDQVNDIREDGNHRLWIATGGGLSVYNMANKTISSFNYPENNPFLNRFFSLGILDNNIFLATEKGLEIFNIETGQFKLYKNPDSRETSSYIKKICIDRQKRIWLGTYNGVWGFDLNAKTFTSYNRSGQNFSEDALINDIFEDDAGQLWVATWNEGLKKLDPLTNKALDLSDFAGNVSNIMKIAEQKRGNGRYAILINANVSRIDSETRSFIPLVKQGADKKVLSASSSIYCDRDNLLWISTDEGVRIFNPAKQHFQTTILSDDIPITSQGIALLPLKGKFLMGAAGNKSLLLYNDSLRLLKNLSGEIPWRETAALDIRADKNNNYWICTNNGLVILNASMRRKKSFVHDAKDPMSLPRNFLNNILFRKNGEIWVMPWRSGVCLMDTVSGKFIRMDGKEAPVLSSGNISRAVEDKNGNVWMTDYSGGLFKYLSETKTVENIIPAHRMTNEFLLGDHLWVASASEIFSVNVNNDSTETIPLPEGKNKFEYDFMPGDSNSLWIAIKSGLLYFNMQTKQFQQFSQKDGLYKDLLDVTFSKLSNGNILMAGNAYITVFSPSIAWQNKNTAPLLFTAALTEGNERAADHDQLDFSWNEKNIALNWALLNYSNPSGNLYYYKMDGMDRDWHFAGNKGVAVFNSLEPGAYTFHYKASTADGIMSEEKTINIVIHPPFWKTWWFTGLVLLLVAGFIYWLFKNRVAAVKRQADLKQQMSELEMKALRAQMNPHFIFNSLNSIQECIIMNNTTAAYDYLSKFSKLVRSILENSGKLFVPLKEEMELLQWYVDLEQLRFKEPVQFTMHAGPEVDTVNITVPSMMLQPYVENALWHGLAPKKGEKKLDVSFVSSSQGIECIITDTGIGRQEAAALRQPAHRKSMGMMITQERLQLFNKQAKVETQDLFDKQNNAAGTKIVIYLPLE